ncbi:MAG: hypothetical protein LW724_19130 [Planctomycetaceae bacterium]|jgi:hypothetical protein|nr:hypothetical protein [Planctomycetaceae bacterium]
MQLNQKKAQKASKRVRLGAYLAAGLGSCTLAPTVEAGIVTIDLSSAGNANADITGINGGVSAGGNLYVHGFFLPSVPIGSSNYLVIYNGASDRIGLDGNSGLYFGTSGVNTSPRAFSAGAVISNSTSTQWTESSSYSGFKEGTSESPAFGPKTYMAMRSQVGTDYYYGWIEVTWNPTTSEFRLISAAYEDTPNTAILAGDTGAAPVPEPASGAVVAMLMGEAALRQWRKKKRDGENPSCDSIAS